MFCGNCGSRVEGDAAFCAVCGSKVAEAAVVDDGVAAGVDVAGQVVGVERSGQVAEAAYTQPTATAKYPPQPQTATYPPQPQAATAVYPPQAMDATYPGQQPPFVAQGLDAAYPGQAHVTAPPPQKKKKTWLVILIIAIVVVLAGGAIGGYFIYTNFFADDSSNDAVDTVTTDSGDDTDTNDKDPVNGEDDPDPSDDEDPDPRPKDDDVTPPDVESSGMFNDPATGSSFTVPTGMVHDGEYDFTTRWYNEDAMIYMDHSSIDISTVGSLSIQDWYDALVETYESVGISPSYKTCTDEFFVISGQTGKEYYSALGSEDYPEVASFGDSVIFYQVYYLQDDRLCILGFLYSADNATAGDKVVEETVATLEVDGVKLLG